MNCMSYLMLISQQYTSLDSKSVKHSNFESVFFFFLKPGHTPCAQKRAQRYNWHMLVAACLKYADMIAHYKYWVIQFPGLW